MYIYTNIHIYIHTHIPVSRKKVQVVKILNPGEAYSPCSARELLETVCIWITSP
jgi:predicted phosphodiesterase